MEEEKGGRTYVVLRRNAPDPVLPENWDLLQDVLADAGNLAREEEEAEEGGGAESGGDGTAVLQT